MRASRFDTVDLAERPGLLTSAEPRDFLTAAFLAHGVLVSGLNVTGSYDSYATVTEAVVFIAGNFNS